jgi:DNA-directed RNA polymerase subunit RPC12/RpoP
MSDVDRRYVCVSCETIVRARWFGPGSFAIGCDCQTVPVVPQMGQDETPDEWRVERPDCCRDAESEELETMYGERGKDYRCPDCDAEYFWDGKMVGAPDEREISADGGTEGRI